jgi:type II secretory pathway component PulF
MSDKILYVGNKKPDLFQFLGFSGKAAAKLRRGATGFSIATAGKLSLRDQTLLAKRLSFLMNANIPLLESLHVLREQTRSKGHGKMLDAIIGDVAQGQSLSRSFSKFPKVFGDFAVHIVKVGETSGTLSQNLGYLSDELKKRHALKRKVVGAFIYPALISLATLGITAFLMLYLFPKIMPVFTSLHMKLPITTRIVMGASTFLREWGLEFVVVAAIAGVVAMTLHKKNQAIRYFFDSLILRIPMLGQMVQYFNIANSSRTLGLLLKSGVRLGEALSITADTTRNLLYKTHYKELVETVNRGEKISLYMVKHPAVFPDIFGHMVAVGEKSGTLSDTLVYLSEMYEAEVDDFTKNLSTLIEPFLMVVMGLVVGFIAISIITPIYGITQNLHN